MAALSFATVPPPAWFCSTHVDRRPLSNGAVVTPAKSKSESSQPNKMRPTFIYIYICFFFLGYGPLTVTVTTSRIITFLVGDSYNPSFTTVTVRGPYPIYIYNITNIASFHNGERHRQEFQICSVTKRKTTSTHQNKRKITSKHVTTQIET